MPDKQTLRDTDMHGPVRPEADDAMPMENLWFCPDNGPFDKQPSLTIYMGLSLSDVAFAALDSSNHSSTRNISLSPNI